MDPTLSAQLDSYKPWFFIAAVFVLFALLRLTRKGLRRRIDEIGYRLFGERGLLIWFWLNAPGVMLHELSHAVVVLFFYPFGFRITSITLFRIKPKVQPGPDGRLMRHGGRTSLQLGEVQYLRPQGKLMSYIGDGLSAVAPLFGGMLAFLFLYWVATGHALWDAWSCGDLTSTSHGAALQNVWQCASPQHILQPGWPWWTLIFAPYLVLTVTSELWPSHQDWRGARWLVGGLLILLLLLGILFWITGALVFNNDLLLGVAAFSTRINFALLVLLGLDLVFFLVAELLARTLR
ncbi:MAG TPA: hypothetical protein VFV38_44030 [Ktedonobacteraceae bacterium]|nr:hypothetical protein [Ktedonobacteraceae bacterium]